MSVNNLLSEHSQTLDVNFRAFASGLQKIDLLKKSSSEAMYRVMQDSVRKALNSTHASMSDPNHHYNQSSFQLVMRELANLTTRDILTIKKGFWGTQELKLSDDELYRMLINILLILGETVANKSKLENINEKEMGGYYKSSFTRYYILLKYLPEAQRLTMVKKSIPKEVMLLFLSIIEAKMQPRLRKTMLDILKKQYAHNKEERLKLKKLKDDGLFRCFSLTMLFSLCDEGLKGIREAEILVRSEMENLSNITKVVVDAHPPIHTSKEYDHTAREIGSLAPLPHFSPLTPTAPTFDSLSLDSEEAIKNPSFFKGRNKKMGQRRLTSREDEEELERSSYKNMGPRKRKKKRESEEEMYSTSKKRKHNHIDKILDFEDPFSDKENRNRRKDDKLLPREGHKRFLDDDDRMEVRRKEKYRQDPKLDNKMRRGESPRLRRDNDYNNKSRRDDDYNPQLGDRGHNREGRGPENKKRGRDYNTYWGEEDYENSEEEEYEKSRYYDEKTQEREGRENRKIARGWARKDSLRR